VIGLGRFFGAKFRSGVLFAIFEKTGDRIALEESLAYYRNARSFWAELADRAKDVYKPDITIGENPVIRGHWLDRLPAIDEDITFMSNILDRTQKSSTVQQDNIRLAIQEVRGKPARTTTLCKHNQPSGFTAGQNLDIVFSFDKPPLSARLYYRHVNHAERFETAEMQLSGNNYHATIPSAYTDSQYPLQYYIELKDGSGGAWLYPGFTKNLTNQPYFVVRKT
jgi:hypothetical protein